jgi:two-component system response regulator
MNATPILLIEDGEDDVFFFQHAVKKAGIANPLQVAKDGQEALDYLAGTGKFADFEKYPPPTLIFLDLKLPRVMGFEVLRRIREQPEWRKLIVLVLTSSASDADMAKAYELGANAYLVKPPESGRLAVILQAVKDFWLTHNHTPPREIAIQ